MHLMIASAITRDGRTICFHTTGRSDADRCVVFLHPAPRGGELGSDPEQIRRVPDDPAHARWRKGKLTNSRIEVMPGVGHPMVVPGWKRVLSHVAPGGLTAGRKS